MRYHVAPWDRPLFPRNTAANCSIHVLDQDGAPQEFGSFRNWCAENHVRLVSCRLAQTQLAECGFPESQGFRFIELNYRPFRRGIGGFAR